MPGSWVGGIIRSDVPRGILKNINTPPEFDADGAVLVTAADIPGENFIAMVRSDYPALAEKEINYLSQALALVAAPTAEALASAMACVKAEIEPLIRDFLPDIRPEITAAQLSEQYLHSIVSDRRHAADGL